MIGQPSIAVPRTARLFVVLAAAVVAACGGSPTRPSPTPTTSGSGSTSTTPPTPTPTPTPDPTPVSTLSLTKFLAFGDSMTEGQSAVFSRLSLDPVTSYPTMLRQTLAARYPSQVMQVDNAGRSGEWAADGQFRLGSELSRYSPQALLLMEGVNDLAALGERGVNLATAAIESMVVEANRRGVKVYLATLPPQRPGGSRATSIELLPRYNDWMRRIAVDRGATLVDVNAAFGNDLSLLSADGLHPTVEGYSVIARAFADAITRTLQQ